MSAMSGVATQPRIATRITELIGQTPLLDLSNAFVGPGPRVLAKLEMFNPAGSAKDRPAHLMIREALADGRLAPGGTVIESSSGNLGVALAQHCAVLGLQFVCVTDPKTDEVQRRLMRAYGARVVTVECPDPESGDWLAARLQRVRDLVSEDASAWWPNQYANPDNALAHQQGSVREAVETLGFLPRAVFVATSSTGTVLGSQRYLQGEALLRGERRSTDVVAVDAVGSVLFRGRRSDRLLPGFGAGVVPPLAEQVGRCEVARVDDAECVIGCRRVARRAGVLLGASGGGVIQAVAQRRDRYAVDDTLLILLHDSGERYLQTVFDDAWVLERLGLGSAEVEARVEADRRERVA